MIFLTSFHVPELDGAIIAACDNKLGVDPSLLSAPHLAGQPPHGDQVPAGLGLPGLQLPPGLQGHDGGHPLGLDPRHHRHRLQSPGRLHQSPRPGQDPPGRHLGDIAEPGGHEGCSDLNIWCNLWTVPLRTATSGCYDTNIIIKSFPSLPSLHRSHNIEKNDLQF